MWLWWNSGPSYAWNASAPYKVWDVFNICCSCMNPRLKVSLICLSSTESQTPYPVERHFCLMRHIQKLWGRFRIISPFDSVHQPAYLLLFSSAFLLLFHPLFTTLPSPLALVSVSVWSFAVRSQQRAVSWEDEGSVRDDWCLKHTHTNTHQPVFLFRRAGTMSGVEIRKAGMPMLGEPLCSFILLCCLFLTLLLAASASLYRNSGTVAPPFPRGSSQWSRAKTRGCLLPTPSHSSPCFFLCHYFW